MALLRLPNGKYHGWKPGTPDHRDYSISDKLGPLKRGRVKATIDTTVPLPPVGDQGNLGSCTGWGTAGALHSILLARTPRTWKKMSLSPLALYWLGREKEASIMEDSGCEIRDVVWCASKYGVPREDNWPYDISKFTVKPDEQSFRVGKWHQAVAYYRCDLDPRKTVDEMIRANQTMPLVIGWACFDNLDEAAENGVIPDPKSNSRLEGGHCTYIPVRHADTASRKFKTRNSWGDWGDKGDLYIDFSWFENKKWPRPLADDIWAIDHE